MKKVTTLFSAAILALIGFTNLQAQEALIISEYIEGSSNNKAIELFNTTDATVSLADYQIAQSANGGGWAFYHEFPEGAEIGPMETYVILNDAVAAELYDPADADEVLGFPSVVHHNGDDARAIIHISGTDTTWIDVFGDPDNDPGSGWDVAGVTEATANHTLIRKPSVTSGNTTILASFGTNADDSEWFVKSQNDFSNLGKHNEPVNVTFTVNTATMPDTLQPYHTVQIKGGVLGADSAGLGNVITWDTNSLSMTNAGGDYWTADFEMSPGDTLNYKFWAGVDPDNGLINGSETGWESGSNNQFILPVDATADTVEPLQWYETREAPFTTEEDSITVYFRVNVGFQVQDESFDPENDEIGIRGADTFFANGWDASAFFLEQDAVNGDNYFYSGYARIHKDSAANVTDDVGYKFVIANDGVDDGTVTWEDRSDRFFSMPSADSTIQWGYFSDDPPSDANIIDTNLNFEVNVGILEGLGYFNSALDTVAVTGTFNGWANLDNRMSFDSFSGTFLASSIPLTAAVESDVAYKYYIRWDASRDDETSENYFPLISANNDGWEEPGITGGGNRIFQIEDAADQPTQADFFNGVSPKGLIQESNVEGGALTVTFRIDMEPATTLDTSPFNPATDSVFLSVEVPFFALTNDLPTYSDDISTRSEELRDRMMFTDEDEDLVYELEFELSLPTLNHFGFNVVYGEPTSADGQITASGPGGTEPGRRYYQYVTPIVEEGDNGTVVSWPSTFTFPILTWSDDDLPFELPPDYDEVQVSNEGESGVPEVFSLSQNYPNPFNPTTNIAFNLGSAANVTLTVYNVLGQKVASLITNRKMNAGKHIVGFDASQLSSGIYFYRLEAGSFVKQRSMTLIK